MHIFAAGSGAAKGLMFAMGTAAGANVIVVAQVAADNSSTLTTVVPAAALTASTGALGYVVKQFAGGKLVHRDPAASEANLAKMVTQMLALSEKSLERERILLELMLNRNPKP